MATLLLLDAYTKLLLRAGKKESKSFVCCERIFFVFLVSHWAFTFTRSVVVVCRRPTNSHCTNSMRRCASRNVLSRRKSCIVAAVDIRFHFDRFDRHFDFWLRFDIVENYTQSNRRRCRLTHQPISSFGSHDPLQVHTLAFSECSANCTERTHPVLEFSHIMHERDNCIDETNKNPITKR